MCLWYVFATILQTVQSSSGMIYKLSKEGKLDKIPITGDLNADPNSPNGPHSHQFSTNNHFSIHIDEPTRITDTSATILDQFVSNMSEHNTLNPNCLDDPLSI